MVQPADADHVEILLAYHMLSLLLNAQWCCDEVRQCGLGPIYERKRRVDQERRHLTAMPEEKKAIGKTARGQNMINDRRNIRKFTSTDWYELLAHMMKRD